MYLSALCNDASQGKTLLDTVINAIEVSQMAERNAGTENEDTEVDKLFILWKATYIQELSVVFPLSHSSSPFDLFCNPKAQGEKKPWKKVNKL